ncbi:hypothetical protein T10_2855 [Trichinella papuae]|uniref:Uncharacterized protein n=1 Tax=Trichinella papuae TaxID=268474 RepID=A0A0V1M872_9BILA|nr:hypothetical protein T10_2855 [Trichinella papuae]
MKVNVIVSNYKHEAFRRLEKRQLGFCKAKPRFTFLIIMTSGSKSLPALIIAKVLELAYF